ncbi:hypothetical protein DL764_003503 [Monosporascus ibericus]|uniref:Uncharacterized protein n=1 Tax=Monosporascus ibericus TaxID=155417 RepID=A0A4Q4TI33_9PEZI|nr:hypothetical protein DL764_003503 [Monosporascus ibericus]
MSLKNADDLFNQREKEILSKAWLCMKSPPEFDMEKLAKLTNYTNPRSLYPVMRGIKKKIAEVNDNDEQEGVARPSTPANNGKGKGSGTGSGTASSRKRKAIVADAEENAATPTKCFKARKSTVKTEATVRDEEMSEEMKDADEKEPVGRAGDDEEMMDGEV